MSEQLKRDLEKSIRAVEKEFQRRVDRMIRKCEQQVRDEKEDSFARALYDYAPSGSDSLLASLESGVKVQLEQARRELPVYVQELRTRLENDLAGFTDRGAWQRHVDSVLAVERKEFDVRLAGLMGN